MEASSGSLKNIFFGENQSFLDVERFKKIHGTGEGRIVSKSDVPFYVRMYKTDSVDEKGQKMWVLSVQTDWTQQNLKLINNVLKSGMWYMELNAKGEIVSAFFSPEFRKSLAIMIFLIFLTDMKCMLKRYIPMTEIE